MWSALILNCLSHKCLYLLRIYLSGFGYYLSISFRQFIYKNIDFLFSWEISNLVLIQKPVNLNLQAFVLRKEGDSNPRYPYEYVSLANWWFQPLTHTSFNPHSFQMRCKCRVNFWSMQIFARYFFHPFPFKVFNELTFKIIDTKKYYSMNL